MTRGVWVAGGGGLGKVKYGSEIGRGGKGAEGFMFKSVPQAEESCRRGISSRKICVYLGLGGEGRGTSPAPYGSCLNVHAKKGEGV